MKLRLIHLPLILAGLGLWFLLCKAFAWLIVWLIEGNWYLLIDKYEVWWEGVRVEVLFFVGIAMAMFFIFSLIMGIQRSREGWKR